MCAIWICEFDSALEALEFVICNFVFGSFLAKFLQCMRGFSAVCVFSSCNLRMIFSKIYLVVSLGADCCIIKVICHASALTPIASLCDVEI